MSNKKIPFALIGAAGYIAPRHLKAIKDTNNELVAALDRNDSVGILDSYFPEASFFTEFERFDRHLDKLSQSGNRPDYISICSPNYLHDSHIRFALRQGANAICEKPLVLNPWNIDALQRVEQNTGKNINTILQLRLHPAIVNLKRKVEADKSGKVYNIDLTYITSRGYWYYTSWKGDLSKSGGIASNIGVHFFDMLGWIFGEIKSNTVHLHNHDRASGYLEFDRARVRWFLSINEKTLPEYIKNQGQRTFRSISIEGDELEFSTGFSELHTESYRQILSGNGFTLDDNRQAIGIVHKIRTTKPIGMVSDYHPLAKSELSLHPFKV